MVPFHSYAHPMIESFILILRITLLLLFDQEEPEKEHDQHDRCAHLSPKLFFAKQVPDQMDGQV